MPIIFSTHSQHKLEEIRFLSQGKIAFQTLKDIHFYDDIPEPFNTLEENSLTKAQTIFNQFQLPTFAEDTGLFVEALQGEPGVLSARYAGLPVDSQRNMEKVLLGLKKEENRKAYFKTVISYVTNEGVYQCHGVCHGQITREISGTNGFGYDPIFIPDGYTQTFAELTSSTKNEISHRKKAFDIFLSHLGIGQAL